MTIVEFLWTLSSCLTIGLLSYLLYTTVRNDLRSEHERRNNHRR
ncbi:TPA: hypothetical protein ACGO2V_001874 [Streptococcus suis]